MSKSGTGIAAAARPGGPHRLTLLGGGAALIVVAHLIGGLGIILCFVGVLFTTVYAYAVTAGVVDWYRRVQTQPAQVGPSPAA